MSINSIPANNQKTESYEETKGSSIFDNDFVFAVKRISKIATASFGLFVVFFMLYFAKNSVSFTASVAVMTISLAAIIFYTIIILANKK